MGVILFKNSKPYVLEASATVKFTPLNKWIAQGNDGHYVVKRLKNALAYMLDVFPISPRLASAIKK